MSVYKNMSVPMEAWISAKGSCGQQLLLLKRFSFSFPKESVGNQGVKILHPLLENMGRSKTSIWKCISTYAWVGLEMLSRLIRKIISSEQKKNQASGISLPETC